MSCPNETEFFSDNNTTTTQKPVFKQDFNNLPIIRPTRRQLIPVIKLHEPKTFRPWENVDCFGVVIKVQNLVSADGRHTNTVFDKIQSAGGIHPYLGYDGIVILSTIMPDKALYGFSAEAYARMINSFGPDFYLTPDGETYLGEIEISGLEIQRMLMETEFLIAACPNSQPIGLVKGCTIQQIETHTNHLLNLGLTRFVFHAGEYLCRGTSCVTGTAVSFATAIRKRVPWLGVYGVGAMKSLRSFSFADGYITQSHFVNPFYGRFRDPERRAKNCKEVLRDDIMNELSHIRKDILSIDLQSTLTRWYLPNISEQRAAYEQQPIEPIKAAMLREGM